MAAAVGAALASKVGGGGKNKNRKKNKK